MFVRPWVILAALTLGRITIGFQGQSVAALASDLVPLLHLNYTQLGSLIGIINLAGIFVALPAGILARLLGDRLILATGLALMVAGAAISGAADGAGGIATGRAIAGVGGVAMIVLQGKIISDLFTGPRFMIAISVSVCAYPIGVGLAQIVLPPVSHAFGWPAGFVATGVPPAMALILFLASYRQPLTIAAPSPGFSFPSTGECLLVTIAGLIWTAYTAGYIGYLSYLPSTLASRGDLPGTIALVVLIATWGNVPATMWGGGLAARFGASQIFLIGTTAMVVGMAGTALTMNVLPWAFLVGVIGAIHPGVIMAVGTLSAKPANRAVGMGLFYTIYFAGNTAGPAFCGRVADLMGTPEGGILAAAAITAFTLPLYLLHRRLADHETMLA